VAPLLLPSVDSVSPGSLGMLSNPAFVLPFSMLILFYLDSSLCSVSPQQDTYPRGGAVGHDPHVAHIGGAPTLGKVAAAGAAAPKAPEALAGDGSSSSAPDTTVAVDMTAAAPIGLSVDTSSPRPQMGAASASAVAGHDIVEPEVIRGHPLLRALGDVSLDRQWGQSSGCSTRRRRCFTESIETSMTSTDASCYGPRCSRSGPLPRRQGRKRGSGTLIRGRSCLKGSGLPLTSSTLHHRRCYPMPRSFTPQPRPRPTPPSSKRGLSCAFVRRPSGSER
jgi:hypothetical protein